MAAKPHPGQTQVAAWIYGDIVEAAAGFAPARLQDRYSIRCAPHVLGVAADFLPFARQILETEINSANDNPLIHVAEQRLLHGGHFYGGHVCFVADNFCNLFANIADLLDRQLALLVDSRFNHGLPSNLSGAAPERASINHGLKAVQIATSAWSAEAAKTAFPASLFSRSTESHNQDKVSQGTIAARAALRTAQLAEQVAAASLLAVRQALAWRLKEQQLDASTWPAPVASFYHDLVARIPLIEEDRPLDHELAALVSAIGQQVWPLYPEPNS